MSNEKTIVGILRWERNGSEGNLNQLENMKGNLTNKETFNFSFLSEFVEGANYRTIVQKPNRSTLNNMIKGAVNLQVKGAKVIVTSCGFNAIFNKELADSVDVPVISSSLIQVPMVRFMLQEEQKIIIITADKEHLTELHLRNAGITEDIKYIIEGLDTSEEFQKIVEDPNAGFNVVKFTDEVLQIIEKCLLMNNNIGAVVFECTDLPPFSEAVREKFNLPVFDIVTLVNMVYHTIK